MCYTPQVSTREAVQKWLDAGRPTKVADLAQELNVQDKHIYRIIGKLRAKAEPSAEDATEALLERCRSGDISDESANRILGKIMADGRDADRIKAIDIHDARNRASSSKIGPPPPHSPQQVIDRLALLFKAAEPEHLMEAAKRSGYQMVPSPTAPQAQEAPSAPGPDDQAEGPSPAQ